MFYFLPLKTKSYTPLKVYRHRRAGPAPKRSVTDSSSKLKILQWPPGLKIGPWRPRKGQWRILALTPKSVTDHLGQDFGLWGPQETAHSSYPFTFHQDILAYSIKLSFESLRRPSMSIKGCKAFAKSILFSLPGKWFLPLPLKLNLNPPLKICFNPFP